MSGPPDDDTSEDTSDVILRALSVLAHDGWDRRARAALADTTVLVPSYDADAGDGGDPLKLTLPVTERTVLVFTSEARMVHSLPDVLYYRLVPLGMLPAHWPEGDPSLTIDAGSPDGLTLPAEGVRLLLVANDH
jgi:hypothetical protein